MAVGKGSESSRRFDVSGAGFEAGAFVKVDGEYQVDAQFFEVEDRRFAALRMPFADRINRFTAAP